MNARLLVSCVLVMCSAFAEVRLASPFGPHMVLQRDFPVPVWGEASPGEEVTVQYAGQTRTAKADAKGDWRVTLDPLEACAEARILSVTGTQTSAGLRLDDVVVGEVWLASGQSNMVFTMSKSAYSWAGVDNEAAELALADLPLVRVFTVAEQKSLEPQRRVGGAWQVCTPKTAASFSAVAYYFARDLQRALGVPVGVLSSAYGASTAQAWIRRDAIREDARLRAVLERFDEQVAKHVPPTQAELEDWAKAVELARAEKRRAPRKPGEAPVQDQHNPTVLYNGMVASLVPYSIRGVLWYQGESITTPRELFPTWNEVLVTDWRRLWGRELPFFFCQLAAYDKGSHGPQVRQWQAETLRLPGTGMVVTIDVGDAKDVHPHNKAPVGNRLARLALARTHGFPTVCEGPLPKTAELQGGSVRVRFSNTAGRLVSGAGRLGCFELRDADGRWHAAQAELDGEGVKVLSPTVESPSAVRYAWKALPEGADLCNQEGLPAAPFELEVSGR